MAAGISYLWLGEELGGLLAPGAGTSTNEGWRLPALRAYADRLQEAPFRCGVARLLERAAEGPTAVMCAEADPLRCHRQILADALVVAGHEVRHIAADGSVAPHARTPFAVVEEGRLRYPARAGRPPSLPFD